jgi:hypothetical protein
MTGDTAPAKKDLDRRGAQADVADLTDQLVGNRVVVVVDLDVGVGL